MTIEFKLPEVSDGIDAVDIGEVLVKEGDVIEAGRIVIEVETEKASAEIECPHAGTVAKIHVSAGDTVPVGAVLLTIEECGAAAQTASAAFQPSAAAAAKSDSPVERTPVLDRTAARREPVVIVSGVESPSPLPGELPAPLGKAGGNDRRVRPVPAGPATRRLARQLGVDLYRVTGSGRGGRVTAEDVQAYARKFTAETTVAERGPMAAPSLPDFSQFGPVERQPLNKIAKASATHLSTSWQIVPHVTQHDLADITELEAARKQYVASLGKSAPKVTMTAVMIKAVVSVLKEFAHFNASLDTQGDELILKRYYHIGCAVDTPNGLLVPVVRDVDHKTILDIAKELGDLAERARDRKLALNDMRGGTFTITNLGGIGGTGFTPIVNYPEVAILGMTRGRKELRLSDGEFEERLMLPLSLSYDHRVINGADAARFLVRLCAMLSHSFHLLVEC